MTTVKKFDDKIFSKFYAIGKAAFATGQHSAPSLNTEVMAALEAERAFPGEGNSYEIMHGFSRGWNDANLESLPPYRASGW